MFFKVITFSNHHEWSFGRIVDDKFVNEKSQLDIKENIMILITLESDSQTGTTTCRFMYSGIVFRREENEKTQNYLVCDKISTWPFADPHEKTRNKKQKSKVDPQLPKKAATGTSGFFSYPF